MHLFGGPPKRVSPKTKATLQKQISTETDRAEIRRLIENKRIQSFINDCIMKNDEYTLLTYASSKGHLPAVTMFIEEFHAEPNLKDSLGWTPLMNAVFKKRTKVVRYLVETCNVDVNIVDEQDRIAIDLCRPDEEEIYDILRPRSEREPRDTKGSGLLSPHGDGSNFGSSLVYSDTEDQEVLELREQIKQLELTIEEKDDRIATLESQLAGVHINSLEEDEAKSGFQTSPSNQFKTFFTSTFHVNDGNNWSRYLSMITDKGFDNLIFWSHLMTNENKMIEILRDTIGISNQRHVKMIVDGLQRMSVGDWISMIFPSQMEAKAVSNKFLEDGFATVQSLVTYSINDSFLRNEIGIEKEGHRYAILFHLNFEEATGRTEVAPPAAYGGEMTTTGEKNPTSGSFAY